MKLLYLLMMLCRCSVPLKFNSAENLASLRRSLRNYFFREVNYFFILAHCVVAEYLYLFGDNKGGCSHTDCVTAHRSKTTKITDLSHLYIHPSKQNALRSNMESNIASASHYLLQKALTLELMKLYANTSFRVCICFEEGESPKLRCAFLLQTAKAVEGFTLTEI